jgi:hypothetical protein
MQFPENISNRKSSKEPTGQLYQQHFVKLGYIFCSNADKNSASHEHHFSLPFPSKLDHFPSNYGKNSMKLFKLP